MALTKQNVRAFLDRPWSALRTSKDRSLAATAERSGGEATLAISGALYQHAIAVGALPTARDRDDDLAAAIRLRRLLDQAGRKRPSRPR